MKERAIEKVVSYRINFATWPLSELQSLPFVKGIPLLSVSSDGMAISDMQLYSLYFLFLLVDFVSSFFFSLSLIFLNTSIFSDSFF